MRWDCILLLINRVNLVAGSSLEISCRSRSHRQKAFSKRRQFDVTPRVLCLHTGTFILNLKAINVKICPELMNGIFFPLCVL